jgi:hypothetical protein
MTEGWTLTLGPDAGWRHVGSTPEKTPVEVIVRSFDAPVRFATGSSDAVPDGPATTVMPGEGARLSGLHFFVRPETPGVGGRVLVRGV